VLIALWALWRDVFVLEARGLVHLGGPQANVEWAALSTGTLALAALFFSRERALRVLGYTGYALVLAVAFGVASVLGVTHAFGGLEGNLEAPAWALALLGLLAAACVAALLATAALIVADLREADPQAE